MTYRDQKRNSLKHLLTELNLEDTWRLHNPDEQVFTHHSHLGRPRKGRPARARKAEAAWRLKKKTLHTYLTREVTVIHGPLADDSLSKGAFLVSVYFSLVTF